ncbi:hypothetical protein FB639_000310 [Coemansia asiatica]|nr:hypothetical protein FB639_000310 [Coemansia asiatica]
MDNISSTDAQQLREQNQYQRQHQSRQLAAESWTAEKDKILERLASNEEDSTPWSELRVIIRQRLAQAVETLALKQEEHEREKQRQRQQSDEDSSGEGTGNQSDTPVAEAPESRKRNRMDTASASDVRLQVPSSKLAETGLGGSEESEEDTEDQVMADATETIESDGNDMESSPDAIKEAEQHQQQSEPENESEHDQNDQQSTNRHNGHHLIQAQSNGENSRTVINASEIHDLEERIGYCLRTFDEAPFTIQRIAELLAWPERHYCNVIKFLRAVERVVYVTSTVDEFPTTVKKRYAEGEDMSIETGGDGSVSAPSTFASVLQASEPDGGVAKVSAAKKGINGAVMTKAVAAKVPTAADVKARITESVSKETQSQHQHQHQQPQVIAGVMPLDASDTGILHITPRSMSDTEVLKLRIQNSVDANVPVFIDDHDGGSSKLTVQPVFPQKYNFGSDILGSASDNKPESPAKHESEPISDTNIDARNTESESQS